MANKKAKKTTKKSATTAPKTTTVVTKGTSSATKSGLASFVKSLAGPKDLEGIFSAKTLSLLFVEMIGAMALTMMYTFSKGNVFYLMFAVGVMVLAFSNFAISFFNPIFTLGNWLTKKISAKKAALLIVAQILGVMLASVLLTNFIQAVPEAANSRGAMFGSQAKPELFKLSKITEGKEWFIFLSEFVGATLFGLLVAQTAKRNTGEKAVLVGGGMFVSWFVANSLSNYLQQGANLLNPALAVSAVDFDKDTWQWNTVVYIIAPILGGVLGFFINKLLVKDSGVKTSVKTA